MLLDNECACFVHVHRNSAEDPPRRSSAGHSDLLSKGDTLPPVVSEDRFGSGARPCMPDLFRHRSCGRNLVDKLSDTRRLEDRRSIKVDADADESLISDNFDQQSGDLPAVHDQVIRPLDPDIDAASLQNAGYGKGSTGRDHVDGRNDQCRVHPADR